jgi:cell division septation protein DedD
MDWKDVGIEKPKEKHDKKKPEESPVTEEPKEDLSAEESKDSVSEAEEVIEEKETEGGAPKEAEQSESLEKGVEGEAADQSEEDVSEEPTEEKETEESAPEEAEMSGDPEKDIEPEAVDEPVKRTKRRSSRFGVLAGVFLASIIAGVLIAVVVIMFVGKEKESGQEVPVTKQMKPVLETKEETPVPPVPPVEATMKEEVAETPQPVEEDQTVSPTMEAEVVEEALTEPPVEAEAKETPGKEEPEVLASKEVEAPAAEEILPAEEVSLAKKMPLVGNFTVNLASFRQEEGADRYVEELQGKGVDAFKWEVNIPEKGRYYRVSAGGFATREEAQQYTHELRKKGIYDTLITWIPESS